MSTGTASDPIEILLAEDNPGDVYLTREALKKGKFQIKLNVAADGEIALAYLRRQGRYHDSPRPMLMLLDLNMPRKDGRQVLQEMKRDPHLASIPVIVFTSSQLQEDIAASYRLHANCYVSKPANASEFARVLERIEEFWFSVAKIPEADSY